MEKIIVKCKKCEKQMKILNKAGKYKCPYCKEVYKLNSFSKIMLKIGRVFKDFIKTLVDMKTTIKYRFNVAKNQYKSKKR